MWYGPGASKVKLCKDLPKSTKAGVDSHIFLPQPEALNPKETTVRYYAHYGPQQTIREKGTVFNIWGLGL